MTTPPDAERHITLLCLPDDPTYVHTVRLGGSATVLGSAVHCGSPDAAIALAHQVGFATTAERDEARLVSASFADPSPGVEYPYWLVTFDISGYLAMLDRL